MYKLLIDGKLVDGARSISVVDPATAETFAECACADEAQLNLAIDAASRAFPQWAALPQDERGRYLLAFADALEARHGELIDLLTREQGKPTREATHEVFGAIYVVRFFAGQSLPGGKIRDTDDGAIFRQYVPLGVVAAITPWNFPLLLMLGKVAPALTVGNTMVAKPAATTPLTACLLGSIAADILPPGVLNIIVDDNDLGAALTAHADIAKISFTGSTATGKRVMSSASNDLKRITLELGGNDPAILLDDVDVEIAAPHIFAAAMMNAGQVCFAAKRVYAPAALVDRLCAELARLTREAKVGAGADPETVIGPLQNAVQFEKVRRFLADAKAAGTLVAEGQPSNQAGFFVAPAIVRDLSDDAELVREEQFGPILPILSYNSIDEVIARANNSPYGLGATIWASDTEKAIAVAERINSGTVWINKHFDLPFDIPFGGAKQSGVGYELGERGLTEYTQAKVINMTHFPRSADVAARPLS